MNENKKLSLESPHSEAPSDPCLDDGSRARSLKNAMDNLSFTKRGRHLLLGLIVLMLVLLIVVIALAASWPKWPNYIDNTCNKPSCLSASAQILSSANLSTSPCENPWSWACGTWLEEHKDKPSWSYQQELEYQETLKARALIGNLIPGPPGSVEWLLSELYSSCASTELIEAEADRPLKKLINNLNGWNALKSWSLYSWDLRSALVKVHSRHGIDAFISVSVETDPLHENSSIVFIRPPQLGLPHTSLYFQPSDHPITLAYKRLLRDVIKLLDANSNDVAMFTDNLFYYERRLAEVIRGSGIENSTSTKYYNVTTVEKVQTAAPSLNILDILAAMYPRAKIRQSTRIAIPSFEFMQELSKMISTSDKGTLNDYIMWTLTRKYLEFISSPFRAAVHEFQSTLTGNTVALERWHYCTLLVRKWGGVGLSALEQNNTNIILQKRKAEELFTKLKDELIDTINKNGFIAGENQMEAVNKLKEIRLQVGLPEEALSLDFLHTYYHEFIVQRGAMFENAVANFEFKRYSDEQRLLAEGDVEIHMTNIIIDTLTKSPLKPRFISELNVITLPVEMLTKMNFDVDYPISVLMARLGVPLSEALISSVYDIVTNVDDKKGYVCFNSLLEEQNQSTLASPQSSIHVSAVRLTAKTLKSLLTKGETELFQHGLEHLDEEGLFALAYTQTRCSSHTPEHSELTSIVDEKLPDKNLLELSWTQISALPSSLSCSATKRRCAATL